MDNNDIKDEKIEISEKAAELSTDLSAEAVPQGTEPAVEKPKRKRNPTAKKKNDSSAAEKPADGELDTVDESKDAPDTAKKPAGKPKKKSTPKAEKAPTEENDAQVEDGKEKKSEKPSSKKPKTEIQNYSIFDDEEATPPPAAEEEATEETEISQAVIDELAYDDEPQRNPEHEDDADSFNDFLASYRRQISEMMKPDNQDSQEPPQKEDEKEEISTDDTPYPFFSDSGVDEDEPEVGEQLTIDLSELPFKPLTEGDKKQRSEKEEYKYNPKKPGFVNNLFDLVEIFVFTVVVVLFISAFFFRHSMVDGGSMKNTLQHGEHLIITNLFYTPERGDIVVFEDYSVDKKPIVKRVIGVAGDTVRVENENGVSVVYLNGERLEENYTLTDSYDNHPTGAWTVGEGELFVLGDHRNDSWDGRSFGLIKEDSVLGKAVLRFYPLDRFGALD